MNKNNTGHGASDIQTSTVVGIGEILWDIYPGGKQLGGAPANFAWHASRLGANGAVISAVGDDRFGEEATTSLAAAGLTTDYIQVLHNLKTGTVLVEIDGNGVPEYEITTDVAWDYLETGPDLQNLAAKVDAVGFGTLAQRSATSRATITAFLEATRPGCIRLLDLNLRAPFIGEEIIRNSLRHASHLKLNGDEMVTLAGITGRRFSGRETVLEIIEEFGLEMAIITRGKDGSEVHTRESVYRSEAGDAAVIDTVGAGDAFAAAFTVGLLNGVDPDSINRAANRLASYVCAHRGALPPYPPGFAESLGIGQPGTR